MFLIITPNKFLKVIEKVDIAHQVDIIYDIFWCSTPHSTEKQLLTERKEARNQVQWFQAYNYSRFHPWYALPHFLLLSTPFPVA